jgi:hypothetical protein
MTTLKKKKIKASQFDAEFERGDVTEYLDLKSIKVRYPLQRISIDFPKNILEELDIAASKIGVTRTSLIKMWVAQQLSNQLHTA